MLSNTCFEDKTVTDNDKNGNSEACYNWHLIVTLEWYKSTIKRRVD